MDREQAIEHLQAAVQIWHGDFLEDFDAGEWAIYRREELHQRCINALLELGQLHFMAAHYAPAVEVYQRLLAIDNLLELAHRELMRCYARQGETGQAVRHYQQLHAVLRQELNTEPSPETTLLYQRLRRGDEI